MKMKIVSIDQRALKVEVMYYNEEAGTKDDGAPRVATDVLRHDIPVDGQGRPVSAADLEAHLARSCPHHELSHRTHAQALPEEHDFSELLAMVGRDFIVPKPEDTQLEHVPETFRAQVR